MLKEVYIENLVKYGRAVPEMCVPTDIQTDKRAHHNTPLLYRGWVTVTRTQSPACFTSGEKIILHVTVRQRRRKQIR